MNIFDFLQTRSKRYIITVSAALILTIGGGDYVTGSELSFSIFYLIPIVLVTWFADRRAGILASITSALIWLVADLSGGRFYSSSAIPYWNAAVRLGFFLSVTLILASLRAAQFRKEELTHFVIHDLRSPLANVVTALNYLLEGDHFEPAQRETIMRMSIASANRMMTLINSLLDLARLESGKMVLNTQPADVRELFEISTQQVMALAARGETGVTSSIAKGAEFVLADSEVTVRVLVNLLSNALKYSPRDTNVEMNAAQNTDGMIVFSVADKGPGIPKEWMDRVFSKFIQVEAREIGIGAGSGLGLSFCRLAVESQGGHIWLESELNQGTTVFFTLPAGTPKP